MEAATSGSGRQQHFQHNLQQQGQPANSDHLSVSVLQLATTLCLHMLRDIPAQNAPARADSI
jgi:hypothetical protein